LLAKLSFPFDRLLRVAPTTALLGAAAVLAWFERGSIGAADWLPAALFAGLLVATLLVAKSVYKLSYLPLAAIAAFSGLALWTALSIAWSPVPSLARDEALLVSLYAFVLATPALTLKLTADRITALAVVALGLGAVAVGTGLALAFGSAPSVHFREGRLYFPITYVNAQAAFALVGFWPAILLAARRDGALVVRATSVGAAAAMAAVWLLTQSAGAAVALGVSAIVVLAVAPDRLRVAIPAGLVAGLAAVAARPLTGPFRASSAELESAVRDGGTAVLAIALAGLAVGIAYVLLDRRIRLSPRTHRLLARAAAAMVAVTVAAGAVAFLATAGDPRAYAKERWEAFSEDPAEEAKGSHFTSFGSERPDFWRVALDAFQEHPVAGIGARGFGTEYRLEGRSDEHPERAHSLPLDLLAETGIVGLLLFALGLVPLLVHAVRVRAQPWGVAALGASSYWLVHAAGDWLWTVPAAGIPLFLVLGIAASGDRPALGSRVSLAVGVVAAFVALLAFLPPWLAARYTEGALRSQDPAGLARARQLDPLAVEPLLAESALADGPAHAIPPLERAVRREPRSAPLRVLLARAYAAGGRPGAARRELEVAKRFDPRSAPTAGTIVP